MELEKLNKRAWVIGMLRRMSGRWPPKYLTKIEARVSRGRYRCNICKKDDIRAKDIQIDHLVPVVDPVKGFTDWNDFIERLFCDKSNFQAVCKPCHKLKSAGEIKVRKKTRAKKKLDKNS